MPPTKAVVILVAALCVSCAPEANPPAPPAAAFTQAERAFDRGEYAGAIDGYRSFLNSPGDETYVPRAWFKLALSQYRLQEYRPCLTTLDELSNRFPHDRWAEVATLRGDAELALGNRVSALAAWAEAWRATDQKDRATLRGRIDRTTAALSTPERDRALEVVGDPLVRNWIEHPAVPASDHHPGTASATQDQTPGTSVTPAPNSPARVAALLPLTGPYRAFGEHAVEGIQLALGSDFERVVVKDTHGSPETARAAFADVAARAEIVAVIGPLRSHEAEAVAPLAESTGVPLLLLAQREGLASRFVLQPVMTRAQQVAALAADAQQRKWHRFGVLAPDDKYGRDFAVEFRTAVERRGGRVTWTESYDPHTRDVATQVARAREQGGGTLDAVFLPDSASAAVAIGGALRRALPQVGLLGPNDWNDPTTLAGAGGALDGAIVVAGFFPDSTRPATRAFVDAFRNKYGEAPDIFAAQAYDAAALASAAMQRGATSRAGMLDTLHNLGPVTGATGMLRVTPSGVERELYLLRVIGERLEELAPNHRGE